MKIRITVIAVALATWLASSARGEEPYAVPLANPSFSDGVNDKGVPSQWSRYGGGGESQKLECIQVDDKVLLLIADGDREREIGVSQKFALKGEVTYQVTARVRALEGASTSGAYLQLRFLPSNQYVQRGLNAGSASALNDVSVKGTAPADTTHGVIYLYTHAAPTPKVLVADVQLMGGLPAPPPPPPEPVPPQYEKLKDLHLKIPLVQQGKGSAVIVVSATGQYDAAANKIQQAIEKGTGVRLPIVADHAPEASVPLRQHLIVLGNRSTNKSINSLYDHYYCLADLKYPGPEGYVIRTIHSPYGNGHSAVLVGASDPVGAGRGAEILAGILSNTSVSEGGLSIGWTMETQLGNGVTPPADIENFETWEASRGYRSIGYFGWCSISKHMAMYYMTGNETSAREVVRLSFPDDQAIHDIERIDGERIENKHDPLAGIYHYNAHMAILFWDLIEESPVFTDEERLKITCAFARQLNHRKSEGVYRLTQPRSSVGSRHGQWSAISLYCLGRYFNKDYPNPIWAQCIRGGELAFASLHEHAWVAGESDNLFADLTAALRKTLADGRNDRANRLAETQPDAGLPVNEAPVAFSYDLGNKLADLTRLGSANGAPLAVAAGREIHLLTPSGELIRKLESDGDVRVVHWWDSPGLLLAGCVDEKVIAFDRDGGRKWEFTSKMDPAVYAAAKTYWFKSAPGHQGIHGLHTGIFDQGMNRCFVGSACTLEILDENGSLVKRSPLFWGPGRKYLIIDGPDDARNLLISRYPNGTDQLSIVSSRSLTSTGRGYYEVPAGHSYVSGWSAQNRTGLFAEDLDGDGQIEVATAINGTWNRVTVYSRDGKALHNAQFGPGSSKTLRTRMRDMDIADLDQDGRKEILVGLSEGLVVCLNYQCEKIWATQLPSPPLSLRCVAAARGQPAAVVAGCDDGTVITLDSKGNPAQIGQVTGRPTHMTICETGSGMLVVLGTEKGGIAALVIRPRR